MVVKVTTATSLFAGTKIDPQTAFAEWLDPVEWQLFATLEFPRMTRPETAKLRFSEMVNSLEREMKTRVCFVNAAEMKSKSGAQVPLHFHAALTSIKPISAERVKEYWLAGVGRAQSTKSDLAVVTPYDWSKDGVGYIVKQINDQTCEWDVHNLQLFNPNIHVDAKHYQMSIRSARRWQAQKISHVGPSLEPLGNLEAGHFAGSKTVTDKRMSRLTR